MIIQEPCAIRGCLKMATVDSRELLGAARFVLCHDCETSIVLDVQLAIEQSDELPPNTTWAYAEIYNRWSRKRKGQSITHRSGVVTSVKELNSPLYTGGN